MTAQHKDQMPPLPEPTPLTTDLALEDRMYTADQMGTYALDATADLRARIAEQEVVVEAARELVVSKGRYHTEQNYKALVEALNAFEDAGKQKD